MDIIVIVGPSSCGKTTTLNLVYAKLLNGGALSTNKKTEGNPRQNDFSDILNWRDKRIAFFTMGDFSGHLIDAIKYYSEENCDLLVCACNDRFVKPFWEFEKHNTITKNKQRNTDDNALAQDIFDLIM